MTSALLRLLAWECLFIVTPIDIELLVVSESRVAAAGGSQDQIINPNPNPNPHNFHQPFLPILISLWICSQLDILILRNNDKQIKIIFSLFVHSSIS
jgi:hypothetical protein